ncbi:MAG TPA: 3-deoxy-D-manno-octulosonic acid transferase [Terriglobales bacterium]|nr:3-deoxy-D-manno-octulosonic acid transferase [Terriglobales bacterium]
MTSAAAMYLLYSSLLALAVVLSAPWWLLRMALHGKYRAGLSERLGRVPPRLRAVGLQPAIWIHAVSVGEALAVASLIDRLRGEFPAHRIVVSTTTNTGQQLARKRFGAENVFYFPLDFAFCIRPYLRALQPRLVVLAETEFWPNFLRMARSSGAQIAVVNARISDRSFPRYRRWQNLLRRALANISLFCAQTETDAQRLRQIGAPIERVHTSGNLKFDIRPPAETALVAELRAAIRQAGLGPVIVAGSTVEGEEGPLLREFAAAVQPHFPNALLVLAPRHPERFAAVAEQAMRSGHALVRRSEWAARPLARVFLLDSIGELASLYALADVAIAGGSFAPRGGHNILEPAFFSKPIVIGPHYHNFRDIVERFLRSDAVIISQQPLQAAAALLNQPARAEQLGSHAAAVLHAERGATDRTFNALRGLVLDAVPQPGPQEVA